MAQLKCIICVSPRRDAIDSDLNAGLTMRDIAARHNVDKSTVNRHAKHREHDVDASAEQQLPDKKSIELALVAAHKSLDKASRRHNLRSMSEWSSVIQNLRKLQYGSTSAASESSTGTESLTDENLTQRRREYLRVIWSAMCDEELTDERRWIEQVMSARELRCSSVITVPAPVLEVEGNIVSRTGTENQPEILPPAEPEIEQPAGTGAHYVR